MKELETILGYSFKTISYLEIALTHSSYANEYRCKSYERLEFLGDSVLGLIISEYLFDKMKSTPEGDLSRIRSSLVCEESLSAIAKRLNFGKFIRLGNGEEKAGSRCRNSILCDVFEAILAAIYLDGGIDSARDYIYRIMRTERDNNLIDKSSKDYKSRLQEKIQKEFHNKSKIIYTVSNETGPEHQKKFEIDLTINGKKISSGSGKSKKEAEQEAAKLALSVLKNETL